MGERPSVGSGLGSLTLLVGAWDERIARTPWYCLFFW